MCVVGRVEGEKFHFSSVKERVVVAAIKAWTVQWGRWVLRAGWILMTL